jgi:hypothetical protein
MLNYFMRILAATDHLLCRLTFPDQWNAVSSLKTGLPARNSSPSSLEESHNK